MLLTGHGGAPALLWSSRSAVFGASPAGATTGCDGSNGVRPYLPFNPEDLRRG
jgi:hypothetical protein